MNPVYKHYWYLYLYATYLTKEEMDTGVKYNYIDEVQDLSLAELNLLYKTSVKKETGDILAIKKPIFNLFGDRNQVISRHGMKDGDSVEIIEKSYPLNENFRNTNQIIDYCNIEVGIEMTKVDVDMDEVETYPDIKAATEALALAGRTFIVKDEYALQDFRLLMEEYDNTEYEVFTVRNVKGLEFRDVTVIDRDMSDNEKYIAYTQAMKKLTVIKDIPHIVDTNTDLAADGEDGKVESEE